MASPKCFSHVERQSLRSISAFMRQNMKRNQAKLLKKEIIWKRGKQGVVLLIVNSLLEIS